MTTPVFFLQSPEWEQIQRAVGRRAWRAGGALVIRHDLPLGFNYLYAPRPSISQVFFDETAAIARKEKSVFLKIDPLVPFQNSSAKFPVQMSGSIQPRETIIIDLTPSEDELLSAMHEKTRYNIRLAERRGVSVKCQMPTAKGQGLETFWRLLQETAARDGFRVHAREYYEKLLAVRSDAFSNELFFAQYHGETIAVALVNFYRETATYLHGASAGAHRAVMAPHLLHWRIMVEAKRRGCAAYDLWGIDEKRWPGLTRFKRGFGGSTRVHPASVDMIYRAGWYPLYSVWKHFSKR